VKINIPRLALAGAGLAAAIAFSAMTPGQAATWGHAKWCAVTNNGGDDIMWECVYDTAEECQPFILAGNRGFCSLNPYWRDPNQPQSEND
jgi:hypothetical protein